MERLYTLVDEVFFFSKNSSLHQQRIIFKEDLSHKMKIKQSHNHACLGLVVLLSREKKNTFWQSSPTSKFPDRIEPVDKYLLTPGDILCLMPDAIHHVETIGDKPTISFNLYGETNYNQRFEFDPTRGTAKNF